MCCAVWISVPGLSLAADVLCRVLNRDRAGLEVAGQQHQGRNGARGCWHRLGPRRPGRPWQHCGGNPALRSSPGGPGSPAQESRDGEHRLVASLFLEAVSFPRSQMQPEG